MLFDCGGNGSYQGEHRVDGLGRAGRESIAWLVDLDGRDRYIRDLDTHCAPEDNVGMGESSPNDNNYKECRCWSLSVLVDSGGTGGSCSQTDRADGMALL